MDTNKAKTIDITLYQGDCLQVMKTLESCSIDTIITDPPGGISFMGKEWDSDKGGRENWIAWMVEVMKEGLRVLKPGGMALVWAIPRTSHWTATAIELAGFEIRDKIYHLFGQGFPKSLDISKAIDKQAGVEREVANRVVYRKNASNHTKHSINIGNNGNGQCQREWDVTIPNTQQAKLFDGYGTALKPAVEEWVLAMKPIESTFAENALKYGVSGLNIDGCRIETSQDDYNHPGGHSGGLEPGNGGTMGKGWNHRVTQQPPHSLGRFPSHVILDEEAGELLDEMSGERKSGQVREGYFRHSVNGFLSGNESNMIGYSDHGGASRFFYCAKASKSERGEDNNHPTVKPLSLMRYLCKLTKTPTGGIVLDMFMGSGTTGIAAIQEERSFIGIEKDPEYFAIAQARIKHEQEKLPLFISSHKTVIESVI